MIIIMIDGHDGNHDADDVNDDKVDLFFLKMFWLQVPLIPPPYGEKTEQDLSIKFFKPLEHFVRLLEYF